MSDRNDIFNKKLNLSTRRFDAVIVRKDYFGFVRTCWNGGVSADLIEICFLTNPADFKAYTENRKEIADGIARAIVEAFGEKYVSLHTNIPKEPIQPVIQKPKTKNVLKKAKVVFHLLN